MNENALEIAITGLATERTRQSDRAEGLRLMYLTLSARPTGEWSQLFEIERRFPRHSMWRKAWIEGDAIVVDCVPEELETYHLRDLQVDVANTNQKYAEYMQRVAAETRRREASEQEEAKRLDDLKNRLKF